MSGIRGKGTIMKEIKNWIIIEDNAGEHVKGFLETGETITTSPIVSERYEAEGTIFTTQSGSEYYCKKSELNTYLQFM